MMIVKICPLALILRMRIRLKIMSYCGWVCARCGSPDLADGLDKARKKGHTSTYL